MPYNLNQNMGTELHTKTEMRSVCWLMCLAVVTGIIVVGVTLMPEAKELVIEQTASTELTADQKQEILNNFKSSSATTTLTSTEKTIILNNFNKNSASSSSLTAADKARILREFNK